MSVVNLQTNDALKLVKGNSVILGRHICGIESKYVSRKQVQISLLEDGRCFIKKFKENVWMKLDNANIISLAEIQVKHGDILEFVDDLKFRFDLPIPPPYPVFRNIAAANSDQDEASPQKEEIVYHSDDEEENIPSAHIQNSQQSKDKIDDNDSIISTESSNIGSP